MSRTDYHALTDEIAKLRDAFLTAVPAALDDHRFGEMIGSPWSVLYRVTEYLKEQTGANGMSQPYDSTEDTLTHIEEVRFRLAEIRYKLERRGRIHDTTKLESPEKEIFDAMTPKLKELTYGSDEYKAALAEMGLALDHHYRMWRHYPQHYPNGIDGMSLLDVIEMLADWLAATERVADGDILKTLEINRERFKISDQLYSILLNTVAEMGWGQ